MCVWGGARGGEPAEHQGWRLPQELAQWLELALQLGFKKWGGGEAAAKREDRMEGTGKDRASKPGALLNLSGRARAWGDSQPTRAHGAKSGLLLRKGPGKWPTK